MKGTKNMKMMRIKGHDGNVGSAYTRLTYPTAATVGPLKTGLLVCISLLCIAS